MMEILQSCLTLRSLGSLFALFIISVVVRGIYNVTLHPLAGFPGPRFRAAFALPGLWSTCKGNYVRDVWYAHKTYGDVVRIAPDAISFSSGSAWKDIYGLQGGKHQLAKDYKRFPDRPEAIILFGSNDEDHERIRRIISHGFTSSAVKQQEALVDGHIKKLMEQLGKHAGKKIDINHWFNVFTFDVISHLTFGESFNSLPTGQLHAFTADFLEKMKIFPIIYVSREYSIVNLLLKLMMAIPSVKKQQDEFFEATKARVEKRINQALPNQHDLMKYIMENNDEKGMNRQEIEGTTTVLLNAGGQETATCLSSTLFYLMRNSETLAQAQQDTKIDDFPYIGAAIKEALRIHPPVSGNIQRRTGQGGRMIDGWYIPPNTSVGVNQFAASHSASNFALPETFAPERWLPAASSNGFEADIKAAYQPFSIGPRNCIGKALALMIASRTLAELLQQFDVALQDDSKGWDERQTFNVGWDRPPLYVVLTPKA
ncbi:hypothetical protein PG993_004794 [Apiospora rasikravindrae]|uniref:Cytochrome P450 n=1 Tax=Apiospora rasikravindrae TaxID=990691 RepID=A0ABR1TDS2_9PEZI